MKEHKNKDRGIIEMFLDGSLSNMSIDNLGKLLEDKYETIYDTIGDIHSIETILQRKVHCLDCNKKRDIDKLNICSSSVSWLYFFRRLFYNLSDLFIKNDLTVDPRLTKFTVSSRDEINKLFNLLESEKGLIPEDMPEAVISKYLDTKLDEKLNSLYDIYWSTFNFYKLRKEKKNCEKCPQNIDIKDCCLRTSTTLDIMSWLFTRLINYYNKFLDEPIDPRLIELLKKYKNEVEKLAEEIKPDT